MQDALSRGTRPPLWRTAAANVALLVISEPLRLPNNYCDAIGMRDSRESFAMI